MKKRLRRIFLYSVIGFVVICVAAFLLSFLINRSLPVRSQVVNRLSSLEKAGLAEVFHLRQALGDSIWPGWGQGDIPIIVYNEEYAFLVGYPGPPAGWIKMPQGIMRGGPWQQVPDDNFEGRAYYHQPLPDPNITPENFTVLVGERWVATIQTREYSEISFYAGFRNQLPSWIRAVFPYKLLWSLLLDDTETYICAVEHEAFHAFQGMRSPSRLEETEMMNSAGYPWNDASMTDAWQEEMDLLIKAVRMPSDSEATELTRQFLARRDQRRAASALDADLVNYEQQREWLEGLAKYAELSIGRQAARTPNYQPVVSLAADPDFKKYANSERFWSYQLDEARRTMGREGETRFYYSGMAQAALLDRLLPAWKQQAFNPAVTIEELLRNVVQE